MAARRPALDQPSSFQWTPANQAWCDEQLKKYPPGRQASCVIPFLWRGQKQEGWVSLPMIEHVARQLGMPYIRVYEVATFYTMFNLAPVGEFHVQICGTTPCMLRGSRELNAVCERLIGKSHHVSADGKFSWAEVECLGACVNAPMAQISTRENDHYYEDLTPARLEDLLNRLERGEAAKPGTGDPQRKTSDPAGMRTSLFDPALYDGSAAAPIRELPNAKPPAPAE
jgi:NADH-quinone oxidoreductase subunit E